MNKVDGEFLVWEDQPSDFLSERTRLLMQREYITYKVDGKSYVPYCIKMKEDSAKFDFVWRLRNDNRSGN